MSDEQRSNVIYCALLCGLGTTVLAYILGATLVFSAGAGFGATLLVFVGAFAATEEYDE